jgi:hypothetical protein
MLIESIDDRYQGYIMLYTVHSGKWLWKTVGCDLKKCWDHHPIAVEKNEKPTGYDLYEMLTINNINSYHNIN